MEYRVGEHVFNDWEIVREIGQGSSGQVWEIKKMDHNISTNSALKIVRVPQKSSMVNSLFADGMDEASVTQFFQSVVDDLTEEIKIMIDMKGFPYIVNCEDYKVVKYPGEIKWDILIRMELLTPVQEYLQKNVLSEAAVLKMAKELLQTLSLFESKNIIHRDIKPDNIFVDKFGNCKIGDFGIARICSKTSADMSKQGTQNYMAPEVSHGKDYDHTVDIYSLGLVLYKFLNNNRLPFYPTSGVYTDWDVQQALIDRMSGKKKLVPPCNASPEFGKIIIRMCEHDPKQRYQNAEEVLADLSTITGSDTEVVGIPGMSQDTECAATGSSKSFDATTALFGQGMVIHTENEAKKTGKSNMTGKSSAKTPVVPVKTNTENSVNSTANTSSQKPQNQSTTQNTSSASGASNRSSTRNTAGNSKKKKNNKKTIMQVLAGCAVVIALIMYFLMNQKYTLSVVDGMGSGTYKGNEKITVTAKDVDGHAFTGWEVQGKLELSEEELASKSVTFKMPRAEIVMTATYDANSHEVLINNGTGTGAYKFGDEVEIVADDPAIGTEFAEWDVEDGSVSLEHADKEKTSFIMPDEDVELTAVYTTLQYGLTVENGSGSGNYVYDKTVKIAADEKSGNSFSQWVVTEGELELTEKQIKSAEISINMPAGDVVLTAEYSVNQHSVVINGGTGSGSYNVGDEVVIEAEEPVTGTLFDGWDVEEGTVHLEHADKKKTSFVMPDDDLVISAVYENIEYKLSVKDGDGAGTYQYGEQVQISARDANDDVPFSHWTIDSGTLEISDLKVKNLVFTMPAEDVSITAHYVEQKHTVKVEDGKGNGMFAKGSTISISAPATNKEGIPFARWEVTAGTVQIENELANESSFTMPGENVTVKAVYEAQQGYSVVVFGGTGSGVYAEGDSVTIAPEETEGKKFNCWFISAEGSQTVQNDTANFTFVMPATDLVITAMFDIV